MVFCPPKRCYIPGFSAVVLPLPLKLLGQWVSYLITLSLDILFSLCNGNINRTYHMGYLRAFNEKSVFIINELIFGWAGS